MGKVLAVLIVIWLVVLAICVQRAVYWDGVREDMNLEFLSRNPRDQRLSNDEIIARNEADRKSGAWTGGAVLWTVLGTAVLIWVWRWERRQEEEVEPRPMGSGSM